jgi:hypothetical protein
MNGRDSERKHFVEVSKAVSWATIAFSTFLCSYDTGLPLIEFQKHFYACFNSKLWGGRRSRGPARRQADISPLPKA